MKNKYVITISIAVLALLILTSCETTTEKSSNSIVVSGDHTIVSPQDTLRIPLYWENTTEKHDERKPWSDKVVVAILKNFSVYDAVTDINFFCPKYGKLTDQQKIKAHAEVIVGLVYYESAFKPASRMVETTMDIDPVTGKQVASEGLMQLSYQDIPNYGSVTKGCGIDWNKDMNLKVDDPKKTILDPLINLECGLRIYTNQLKNKKTILRPTGKGNGLYWAVVSTNGKYTKKNEIAARVQKYAPECK